MFQVNLTDTDINHLLFLKSDTNECLNGAHRCDKNAVCHDTNDSYTCTCKSGYMGNGFRCQGIF